MTNSSPGDNSSRTCGGEVVPDARLGRFVEEVARSGSSAHILQAGSLAIALVDWNEANAAASLVDVVWSYGQATAQSPVYRGVGLDRLPHILEHGCDVYPTTALLFASPYADKCLEYGSLIQVFHGAQLESTWREVPASMAPDDLAAIMTNYPTKLPSSDGTHLWLSRFPANDPRISSTYEVEWGRWIPGDAMRALAALLIVSRSAAERDRATAMLASLGASEP